MGSVSLFCPLPRRGLLPRPARRSSPKDIAGRLAEAYARGREEGLVEGRADASDRHAAELAAIRREAETDQLELQRNECAELESAIRTGLRQIEDNVGAAVTRILAPFVNKQVVKQAVDELCNAIARLGAAGLPGVNGPYSAAPSICSGSRAANGSSICRSRSPLSTTGAQRSSSRPAPRKS